MKDPEVEYVLAIRALGESQRVQISEERFAEISLAWNNLVRYVQIEEEWSALIENYVDLERSLLGAAVNHMVMSSSDYHDFQDTRLTFSIKLSNLLSTCKSYLDRVPHQLNEITPARDDIGHFRSLTNREYDRRLGYRLMEALRAHTQHRGPPLHGATYENRRVEGENGSFLSYSVATQIDLEKLRKDPKFKKSALAGLEGSSVRADTHIRDYIEGLGEIHADLRSSFAERLSEWIAVIHRAIEEFQVGAGRTKVIGLCAAAISPDGVWVKRVPLIQLMIERIRILGKRNRSLSNLTSRIVTNAPS